MDKLSLLKEHQKLMKNTFYIKLFVKTRIQVLNVGQFIVLK